MDLSDVINEEIVLMDLKGSNKEEIIKELVKLLEKTGKISSPDKFVKAVLDREKLGSTGIGKGIAIPHGKVEGATGVLVALGISKKGVDFDALDDKPVHSVFLIAASPENSSKYLQTLAKLSRMVRSADFRETLINAETSTDVIKNILEYEEE
ncbi:MAG: PTS sugar transporter subunit IIA [Candidatus Muiribacteriota bacterium]